MITALYAGILALFYVGLSFYVISGRLRYKVRFQDGGHDDLIKRVRIHGNFMEYVPFALLLMLLLDIQQAAPLLLHGLGVTLIIGRICHMLGLLKTNILRAVGMLLTFLVLIIAGLINIYLAL